MVRAWLWPVYGGKKNRKEPFQWTVGLRYRRIRDLFGQFLRAICSTSSCDRMTSKLAVGDRTHGAREHLPHRETSSFGRVAIV
jgi:hypothetical protein